MKKILFLAGGGLLGAWLMQEYMKKKAAQDGAKQELAIAEIAPNPVPAAEPLIPPTMIRRFDATPNATVSPAMVTIVGAGSMDDVDHASIYTISD